MPKGSQRKALHNWRMNNPNWTLRENNEAFTSFPDDDLDFEDIMELSEGIELRTLLF